MPHLKAKLKITSPIWKCLPISHSKLIYNKTNFSICNTLGETLGNLPSILIQQIWLISACFPSSNFRLLIWCFSIPLWGGINIKCDSNSNRANKTIVTQLCSMATPPAHISARRITAELPGSFPSVVCLCRWCGLTWESRNWSWS